MDLSSLSTFVNVVQTGSFTKAAASIGTHKARVSRGLSQLERELGVRLLERTTRRVRLTEVGQQIYRQALGVLAAVAELQATAGNLQGEPRGTLRLTTATELGLALNHWLDGYTRKYPLVTIEVEFTGRPVDLVAEGFDLALRSGPPEEERGLVAREIGELTHGLYASPAYLDAHGTPQEGDELTRHRLLMFMGGPQRGWRLVTLAHELRVEGPPRVQANDGFLVCDAAVRGLGIALLPTVIAKDAVARGTLRRVLSAWSTPRLPVHAVYPSSRQMTPKVRAFIDLAAELPLA